MSIAPKDLQTIRGWSGRSRPTVYAKSASINFAFGDGKNVLTSADLVQSINCQAGFTGRLVLARIKADVVGSATFSITYGQYVDYASGLISFSKTNVPTLTSAIKADLTITGWHQYIQVQDEMVCSLLTLSGSITRITLSLTFKHMPAPGFGSIAVVSGGNTITSGGNTVVLRA